jgi:hypothetical protein
MCFDEQTFLGSIVDVKIVAAPAEPGTIDVASRHKQMWLGPPFPRKRGKSSDEG